MSKNGRARSRRVAALRWAIEWSVRTIEKSLRCPRHSAAHTRRLNETTQGNIRPAESKPLQGVSASDLTPADPRSRPIFSRFASECAQSTGAGRKRLTDRERMDWNGIVGAQGRN